MVDSQQNVEKTKDGDAEDISVIAQRFLNIFRQLHVFTPERKQSFDDAILALPPEVRGSFSKLLGGSVLQEYVDELEKKTGNVSARDGFTFSNTAPQANAQAAIVGGNVAVDRGTEQLLAKVLENSQKNAQAAAQAQMQFQAKLIETMKAMPQATASVAHAIDNSKLEEIVSGLIKSQLASNINTTYQSPNNTSAVDGSKLEDMVKSLIKSQLATNKDNQTMHSDSTAHTQAIDSERLDSIISKVVKSQAELIADAARIQTEQLSKAITAGLRESYNYSTQSIIETLKTMNRDSVDALRESFRLYASTQKPIMVSNYNVAGAAPAGMSSGQNYQIAENAPKEIVYDKAPEEFYYETEPAQTTPKQKFDNNQKLQNENIHNDTEILSRNQKKKKKKNKNKNNEDINLQPSFSPNITNSLSNEDDIDELSLPEDDEISLDAFSDEDFVFSSTSNETETPNEETNNDWNWVDNSTIQPSENSTFEAESFTKEGNFIEIEDAEEVSEFYNESIVEETINLEAPTHNPSNSFYDTTEEDTILSAIEDDTSEYEYIEENGEEVEEYTEEEINETIEPYSNDLPNASFEDSKNEETTSSLLSSDALLVALNAEGEDELELDEEENIVENYENELVANSDYGINPLDITTNEDATISAEEEWEYVEEETTTEEVIPEKNIILPNEEATLSAEEEWEYVEVSDDENIEYEWEYVEEEDTTENTTVQSSEGEDTEEWEWVEEGEAGEDGEWEWEYEEVPEDEKTLVDQEPITFEEEYIEPEGEYSKKPSPISSDGVIEQESIFNFAPTTVVPEDVALLDSSETEEINIVAEEPIETDNISDYGYMNEINSEKSIENAEQWKENALTDETYNIFANDSINQETLSGENEPFEFDEELSGSDENLNFEIESLKTEEESIPELEDYLSLEEIDSNSITAQDGDYENFDIFIGENNDIVEDLETIDIDAIEGDDTAIKPI